MSIENYAQGETQSARRGEGQPPQYSAQPDCESGAVQPGDQHGDFGERVPGAIGTWADRGIIGGIISRMISDKQKRIREVRDCITWYQDEEKERLAELQDLQQLIQQIEEGDVEDVFPPLK